MPVAYKRPGIVTEKTRNYLKSSVFSEDMDRETRQRLESEVAAFESASRLLSFEEAVEVFSFEVSSHTAFLEALAKHVKALSIAGLTETIFEHAESGDPRVIPDALKMIVSLLVGDKLDKREMSEFIVKLAK